MDMVMDDESSTSMPRTTRSNNDKADVKNNEDDKENDDKQRQRQQMEMEMVMDVRQVLAQPPRGGGRETPVAKNHW